MNDNEFTKDPDATLDYTINWASWLGADTISSSSWVVPIGITLTSDSRTTTTTTIWLSGGTVGKSYICVNTIVTAGGRTDNRSITVYIEEK